MPGDVGLPRDAALEALLEEEERLEERMGAEAFAYSGLKDLDAALELTAVKLSIALHLMEALVRELPSPSEQRHQELAAGRAAEALRLLEELLSENLSEDQKNAVTESPGYGRVRELFQQFLLLGGAGLLAPREEEQRKNRLVARAMVDALRKYLPQLDYACGIEEGREVQYSSEHMHLPLSQAVLYLETQLLPELDRELAQNPADPLLQRRKRSMTEKLAELRRMKFIPRSTPIVIEKDFYTEWWSGYTADGELLVSMPLPVRFRSGTNLDRLKELVQADVVRRLAGKRVSADLDRDLRYRKSLASGRHGSSRLPRFKLDLRRGFGALKRQYPVLQRLEDKKQLAALVELIRSEPRGAAQKALEGLVRSTTTPLPLLP
jgi:hypothetical protein